jgi:hypothetical protein
MKIVKRQRIDGRLWVTYRCPCGWEHGICRHYKDRVCEMVVEHENECFFWKVTKAAHDES